MFPRPVHSLHKWDVLLSASLSASHSVVRPLLLVYVAYRLRPLEPFDLISSVQLNDDRFSWTTRRDEHSELCYLTLNPVYESSFFLCPKRDATTSTTIARRWLPISIEEEETDADADTKRRSVDNTTPRRPDNGAKRRDERPRPTLIRTELPNA